jgi:hypothetical protein
MKQYFIGFNKRFDAVFDKLFDLGATLMFYWHPRTILLNGKYEFYDGEWMFYSVEPDKNRIDEIKLALDNFVKTVDGFKYEIVPIN